MKKIIYLFSLMFFLAACAPQLYLRYPDCSSAKTITVIRVFEESVLGWTDAGATVSVYSPTTSYQADDEHYVYLKREPHQVYYPGQVIHLPDSTCIKYAGSYSYTMNNQFKVTTPKGVFAQGKYFNTEYTDLKNEMYEKAKVSPWWKRQYERNFGKQ